jgi:hypothetical protein
MSLLNSRGIVFWSGCGQMGWHVQIYMYPLLKNSVLLRIHVIYGYDQWRYSTNEIIVP